jgi:hypothetical protein
MAFASASMEINHHNNPYCIWIKDQSDHMVSLLYPNKAHQDMDNFIFFLLLRKEPKKKKMETNKIKGE